MTILSIKDNPAIFAPYGQLLPGDFSAIVAGLTAWTLIPPEGNVYQRDEPRFHTLAEVNGIQEEVFGLLRMQAGYCNGHNQQLNALENHASPEVDVAGDDQVLFLARENDVENGMIVSQKVQAFLLKKGEAVLLSPYTFHFSPCAVTKDGFRTAILLPWGTNEPLEKKSKDPRLWMKNKWLYAHPDSPQAARGAYVGISGENLRLP